MIDFKIVVTPTAKEVCVITDSGSGIVFAVDEVN